MESITRIIKETMLYVLWGVLYGGVFLFFVRLLMAVSF